MKVIYSLVCALHDTINQMYCIGVHELFKLNTKKTDLQRVRTRYIKNQTEGCKIKIMTDQKKIACKQIIDNKDLLMASLAKYFSNKHCIQKVLPIVNGKADISLRLIDWFVTNFSKKHGTIITYEVCHNIVHFNVYLSYRSQLKAYSKQQFDPFRRRDRISFVYEKNKSLETTIGQLNFFRWVIENNILEYIQDHVKEIEQDMLESQKMNALRKELVDAKNNGSTRKKRNELSKSFIKNMNRFDGSRLIQFD